MNKRRISREVILSPIRDESNTDYKEGNVVDPDVAGFKSKKLIPGSSKYIWYNPLGDKKKNAQRIETLGLS